MTADSFASRDDQPRSLIDCTTAARRLWDYVDGELDDARMAEVEAHLAICQQCPAHFAFAKSLLESIKAARARLEDPRALRQRVVAALRDAGFSASRA